MRPLTNDEAAVSVAVVVRYVLEEKSAGHGGEIELFDFRVCIGSVNMAEGRVAYE